MSQKAKFDFCDYGGPICNPFAASEDPRRLTFNALYRTEAELQEWAVSRGHRLLMRRAGQKQKTGHFSLQWKDKSCLLFFVVDVVVFEVSYKTLKLF